MPPEGFDGILVTTSNTGADGVEVVTSIRMGPTQAQLLKQHAIGCCGAWCSYCFTEAMADHAGCALPEPWLSERTRARIDRILQILFLSGGVFGACKLLHLL